MIIKVSVHIHIAPMLLTYGLRWYESDRFVVCDDFPTCADVNPLHMLLEAETKFYLLWIVGYYVFIFLFLGKTCFVFWIDLIFSL